MMFDPLADPWGTALLTQGTIVVASGVGALVPALRRGGGWLLGLSLVGFLGTAVAGAWVRVQADHVGPPVAGAMAAPERHFVAAQEPKASGPTQHEAPPDTPRDAEPPSQAVAPPISAPVTAPSDPEQVRLEARRALHEGKRVATDEDLCIDAAAVAAAWQLVAAIPSDVYSAKAQVIAERLEACRKKVLWTLRYALHKQRVEAREAFAEQLPAQLATRGITASVGIHGMAHERMRIGVRGTYEAPLDGVVTPDLAAELERLGFTDVYVSYGKLRAQRAFEPVDENALVQEELGRHRLHAPLRLQHSAP